MPADIFTSPGAVTETLAFAAECRPPDRVSGSGGLRHGGDDIEVLEPDFDDALAMMVDGRVVDAKTIMLPQHLRRACLPLTALPAGALRVRKHAASCPSRRDQQIDLA
ncbi:hypothetical protein [Lichenicoccus sp.]|uniref:hypothetical protein n=1 Tax=Lichenicoccus sp. TaxID=2781899 RepID=UPI003D0E828A